MSRPKANTSIDIERRITREICQDVKLNSCLNFAELEKKLNLDDIHGTQNGRNFARYCTDVPEKSRAASRDTLAKIIQKSIEFGWLPKEYLRQKGKRLEAAIPLNTDMTAAAIFKDRQNELDRFLDHTVNLKHEVAKTISAINRFKHLKVNVNPVSVRIENGRPRSFWLGLEKFASNQNDLSYCPPRNLLEALEWVQLHLTNTGMRFEDGLEPTPELPGNVRSSPYFSESEIKARSKGLQILSVSNSDFNYDHDTLMKCWHSLAIKSKSGAKVVHQ